MSGEPSCRFSCSLSRSSPGPKPLRASGRFADPRDYVTELAFRLTPADRKGMPEGRTFRWAVVPGGDVLSRLYPPAVMRDGIEGTVWLVCRVQPDLSGACEVDRGRSVPDERLHKAALQFARSFRAAENASDGSSPVGLIGLQPIAFRLGD